MAGLDELILRKDDVIDWEMPDVDSDEWNTMEHDDMKITEVRPQELKPVWLK